MKTEQNQYLLFPYTVLSRARYRQLAVLFPRVHLMQLVREPGLPEPGPLGEHFSAWPVMDDAVQRAEIERYWRGCLDLAEIHGMNSLMSSVSHGRDRAGYRESRPFIESELKGRAPEEPDPEQQLLLESAVFLELARDYDEKEMQLEESLPGIDRREDEFRDILGISSEEELKEVVDTYSPPLAPEGVPGEDYLSFMAARRIACWYRMLAARPPEKAPLLVTLTRDLLEELIDPFRSEWAQLGGSEPWKEYRLAPVPDLDHLPEDAFSRLAREVAESDAAREYWQQLAEMLVSPGEAAVSEGFLAASESFGRYLESRCRESRPLPGRSVGLSLVRFEQLGHNDLWRRLDRTGFETLGALPWSPGAWFIVVDYERSS